MISKTQVCGLTIMLMTASGAAFVAPVSAETTLIAQWLNNGSALISLLAVEGTGEALLEDAKAFGSKVSTVCSGIFDGTVGPEGKGEITKELNLAKEEVGLSVKALTCRAETTCENNADVEEWPVGLPWPVLLFLMENGQILALVEKAGVETLCLVLGVVVEDECTATDSEGIVQNSAEGDAIIPSGAIAEPAANCTVGGANAGVTESVGITTIKLVEAGTLLSVSSE